MKICNKCDIEKQETEFSRCVKNKDGLKYSCKSCDRENSKLYRENNKDKIKEYFLINKEEIKEYRKEYYKLNKDKLLSNNKNYYNGNKDKIQRNNKIYQELNKEVIQDYIIEYREQNSEKIAETQKLYRETHKEQIKNYYNDNKEELNQKRRNRLKDDDLYRLSNNVRSMVKSAINRSGYKKESSTYDIIGCGFEELIQYLNDNKYGFMYESGYFDIDHIIPLSSAKVEYELLELFHYSNLQLLPSYYNRHIKSSNEWDEEDFKNWLEKNEI